jgi:predicted RNA-binding Zn-ribbon protein involved in translation (DUF1610 family)
MDIPMRCPNCGRRAFDTSGFYPPYRPIEISLKCPQCGRIVRVAIAQDMRLPTRKGGKNIQTMNR